MVHYGDTHGYDKDQRRDHAWPYRDYVIKSLNDDLPYDRFIREQVAGDVIRPGDSTGVIATGFIAAGPWDFVGHVELREGTVDKLKTRVLDRDDMVTNTMSTFQSVTVHCARCHDHKFDPIPQRDYYRLQAVFADIDRGDRAPRRTKSWSTRSCPLHRGRSICCGAARSNSPASWCNPEVSRASPVWQANSTRLSTIIKASPRAALADWIASPTNMLTWRSIVNRVWHYHFGRGIVDTPNDFGRNGSKPTHPELAGLARGRVPRRRQIPQGAAPHDRNKRGLSAIDA